jgi:hypothetical protein
MNFQKLELDHYKILKPFFERQPFKLSVFSLVSVFTWRKEDGFSVYFAIENDTLFMAAKNPARPGGNYLALPLPPDLFGPEKLADLAKDLGFSSYNLVPEAYFEAYGERRISKQFKIVEQKKYADYVYKTENLVDLSGHQFSKKRNLIKQFERKYQETDQVKVENIRRDIADECIDFLKIWYLERGRNNCSDDQNAAIRTFKEFDELELSGIAVRLNGEICGLATCARLTEEIGVLNLQMAVRGRKGLYQFLDRECAARLFLNKYKYINKESDMGLPGLRQSKRSYNPVLRVRCYRLSSK